jgi:cold shock CspA family protein
MQGTMLWFNADKGYGFIQTEDDERLYVGRAGFATDHDPQPRCKGREVSFQREIAEGDARAVNVAFIERDEPRRARLRKGRGGTSL